MQNHQIAGHHWMEPDEIWRGFVKLSTPKEYTHYVRSKFPPFPSRWRYAKGGRIRFRPDSFMFKGEISNRFPYEPPRLFAVENATLRKDTDIFHTNINLNIRFETGSGATIRKLLIAYRTTHDYLTKNNHYLTAQRLGIRSFE